jgi:hypothetical protein
MDLVKIYQEYKNSQEKEPIRKKFQEQLAMDLIMLNLKGKNLKDYMKELRIQLVECKINELNDLQRAFDQIEKILF